MEFVKSQGTLCSLQRDVGDIEIHVHLYQLDARPAGCCGRSSIALLLLLLLLLLAPRSFLLLSLGEL